MCTDDEFVREHLRDDDPERKILYEDPELGFCILGHVHHGAKESSPHDHGPTWAIYGQAQGETIMTDYEKLAAAGEGQPGKARPTRDYKLTPGSAYVYNEGDLHSPRRDGPTRLIRIEGRTSRRSAATPTSASPDLAASLRRGHCCFASVRNKRGRRRAPSRVSATMPVSIR